MLKLLAVALAAQRVFAGLPLLARFPLVFLSVLLGDMLPKGKPEGPLYLEDVLTGALLYAGVGLLCWWFDAELSLHTGRHAGPVVPALLLAVIDRAWPSRHFSSKGR
jgi:hypothetical protein